MEDMSLVNQCTRTDCVYNSGEACHTMAINVGPHAECSTYMPSSEKAGFQDTEGGIGACQALDCEYNKSLECQAGGIQVDGHERHADCETYHPVGLDTAAQAQVAQSSP